MVYIAYNVRDCYYFYMIFCIGYNFISSLKVCVYKLNSNLLYCSLGVVFYIISLGAINVIHGKITMFTARYDFFNNFLSNIYGKEDSYIWKFIQLQGGYNLGRG